MEGGGQAGGGRNEFGERAKGAGWQTEGGNSRASGCRSRAEVTGGQSGNQPPRVAVQQELHMTAFVCHYFFVLTNLVVLFNLKNRWGGEAATRGYFCCDILQPLTVWFCSLVPRL